MIKLTKSHTEAYMHAIMMAVRQVNIIMLHLKVKEVSCTFNRKTESFFLLDKKCNGSTVWTDVVLHELQ